MTDELRDRDEPGVGERPDLGAESGPGQGAEPPSPAKRVGITRRGLLALGAGAGIAAAGGAFARAWLWEKLRWAEDFLPGEPPDVALVPEAWTTTADEVTFAVLGDNGSGGRNAMDVARAMATAYQHTPYGLVLLAGDISYYGSIDDRWQDVFVRPYRPLIDAGVRWELAIGNHEITEKHSPDAAREIAAQLRRLGKPGTFYVASHGPVDVFVLDSSTPAVTGEKATAQIAWLDDALAASTAQMEGRRPPPPALLLGPTRLEPAAPRRARTALRRRRHRRRVHGARPPLRTHPSSAGGHVLRQRRRLQAHPCRGQRVHGLLVVDPAVPPRVGTRRRDGGALHPRRRRGRGPRSCSAPRGRAQ